MVEVAAAGPTGVADDYADRFVSSDHVTDVLDDWCANPVSARIAAAALLFSLMRNTFGAFAGSPQNDSPLFKEAAEIVDRIARTLYAGPSSADEALDLMEEADDVMWSVEGDIDRVAMADRHSYDLGMVDAISAARAALMRPSAFAVSAVCRHYISAAYRIARVDKAAAVYAQAEALWAAAGPGGRFDPSWATSEVRGLVTAMKTSKDFSAAPILADALQEAGCDNESLLGGLRRGIPLFNRCWLFARVTGKKRR